MERGQGVSSPTETARAAVAPQIAQEEAQRALEVSEGAMSSRIIGYGKGKAPEKHMCVNCLHKGVECEWDEGGHGESELIFSF